VAGPLPADDPSAVALPLTATAIPGRTRPQFEELPPGPPSWPGWVAIVASAPVSVVALFFSVLSLPGYISREAAFAALGAAALTGMVAVGGLAWLVVVGIRRRRTLRPERYRGGSVIALLMLVIVAGNLVVAPLLVTLLNLDFRRMERPEVGLASLLINALLFLVIYGIFVAWPQALAGLRLFRGARSVTDALMGGGVGLLAAVGSVIVAVQLQSLAKLIGWDLSGEQAVVGMTRQIPIGWAIVAIAICAPIAEELFFRGLVFNAWEREYGTRRALFGSALLFAVVHVIGGTVVAVVQVFLLGLLLAYVYRWTRTLATTMGLHAAFNLFSVLALFLLPRGT
jgi:membrane protease YdiL (CAAX protease family)